jgi:hypothetical protein
MNPTGLLPGSPVSAEEYIKDNFEPSDRIALLVLDRERRETLQRLLSAAKAGTATFQAWLRCRNQSADVYLGMNPLKAQASGRTKQYIARIRHLYLDLDHDGPEALRRIMESPFVPVPNYVLTTSPERHQVIWKVEDIPLDQAEVLLRAMVWEFGGDPAATDAARVLRLPGFANKKCRPDFLVTARHHSREIYHLPDFPLRRDLPIPHLHRPDQARKPTQRRQALSQSEHDWAYAKRALARGDHPEDVIRRIAEYRARDKHDPAFYARLTVSKAQANLIDRKSHPDPGKHFSFETEASRLESDDANDPPCQS